MGVWRKPVIEPEAPRPYVRFLSYEEFPLAKDITHKKCVQTIEFRDFKLHVIFSMHKRAVIRRHRTLSLSRLAQHIVDRWRDAVSPGSPPFASDDVDFRPCDISLDFPFRGAYRGLNVPGA